MNLTADQERAWLQRIHNMFARAGRLYQEAVEEENRYREYLRDKYEVPAVPQIQ